MIRRVMRWQCSMCKNTYEYKTDVRACCKCMHCKKPSKFSRTCTKCVRTMEHSQQRLYEAAKKIPYAEYDQDYMLYDPVYDRYFSDVGIAYDFYISRKVQLPAWLWATTPNTFHLDATNVIVMEAESADHADNIREALLEASDSLQKALDEWCEAQNKVSYMIDVTVAVLMEEEWKELANTFGESSPT